MKRLITFLMLFLLVEVSAQIGLGTTTTPSIQTKKIPLDYSRPQTYEIGEIKVIGSKYLDHNALIALTGLKVGDQLKIPSDAISGAIKKLWKQGIIGNVEIYAYQMPDGKAALTIELTERPRLSNIEITGVGKSQISDLNDEIQLIKGRVLTDALKKNAELSVKRYFINKGFLNVSVDMSQHPDTILTNSVRLVINVKKKKKVKVRYIDFEGNEEILDAKLRGKLKNTKEYARISLFKDWASRLFHLNPKNAWQFMTSFQKIDLKDIKAYLGHHIKPTFFSSSKFIKKDFEEDKTNLISFYNSKGFRDAKVVGDSIAKNNDHSSIDINIEVEEGQKYYFREITWTGNYIHNDRILDRILGVKKGDVYDMDLINKKLTYNPTGPDISSLYMDDGYLFFNVQPIEVRVEEDSIDIEMRMYEGPQATIERIIVKGNDRTSDKVIIREIRTLPGNKFSRAELIRTQRELSQLGYFDPEQIGINPIPNPAEGTVDIEYTLVEKPSDQVELSAGWGGAFGFVGTLGLVFNNFSLRNIPKPKFWRPLPVGDGQKLALRVQANGRQYQNYSISFSEPWLGGKKPNSLNISLSHTNRNEINFNQNITGSFKIYSVSLGVGRRLKWPDDYFTLSNSINYQIYHYQDFQGYTGIEGSNGTSNNINFNTTFARNSLDNPIFSRNGSSISLSLSLTPPYSQLSNNPNDTGEANEDEDIIKVDKWVEYHKWMFDAAYYAPIIEKFTFHARAHLGYIGTYKAGYDVGPFERFTLGGSGLAGQNFILARDIIALRGYEDNSINPPNYAGGSIIGGVEGGVVYNKFVLELRYPISLNPAATIFVLGFAEGGNNWGVHSEFNPFNLYKSAGVGARIFMPAFGLIGIDWGYGFNTLPGANSISGSQFHFTIGQQIR